LVGGGLAFTINGRTWHDETRHPYIVNSKRSPRFRQPSPLAAFAPDHNLPMQTAIL
jgi:hypothetical protein